MIEIQCTSCHTRYRIDERVLPEDTPTFKCSRCGHVFTTDAVPVKSKSAPEPLGPPNAEAPRTRSEPPKPAGAPGSRPIFPPAKPEPPDAQQDKGAAPQSRSFTRPRPAPAEPAEPSAAKPEVPRSPVSEPLAQQPAAYVEAVQPSAAAERCAAGPQASETPRANPFDPRLERESVNPRAGENLTFDFSDDSRLGQDASEQNVPPGEWSVGDDFTQPEPRGFDAPVRSGSPRIEPAAPAPAIGRAAIPDDVAYIERARLHSAGFFIGLFFAVAVIFAALTVLIGTAPSASGDLLRRLPVIGPNFDTPTPLESMITVGDLQAKYETVKGGHPALVLSGAAKNTSNVPLHVVEVGVRLLDPARHEVANGATYCGNALSAKMIGEMTPHELDFLQKLDPQKTFVLEADRTAPFLMVFIDPPKNVSGFAVAVSKAEPAAPQPTPTPHP